MSMTCHPTPTKSPDSIDTPALKAKYIRERQRRMHPDGQQQYIRPTGALADNHVADPHTPVAPRAPIAEELDVAILGVFEQVGREQRRLDILVNNAFSLPEECRRRSRGRRWHPASRLR
jgi:hypothetical protein